MEIKDFTKVKSYMSDKQSADIYDALVMYSFTKEYGYIRNFINKYNSNTSTNYLNICDLINRNVTNDEHDRIVLFGAAELGKYVKKILEEFDIDAVSYTDNDESKIGKKCCGIPVRNLDEFLKSGEDFTYVICVINFWKRLQVYKQLRDLGISENRIIVALDYYENQYFEDEFMQKGSHEIFVDAGSLDCATCQKFSGWVGGMYDKIYTFEPDPKNHLVCQENIANWGLPNVSLLPYCLWDKEENLRFSCAGDGSSSVNENGKNVMRAKPLDDILAGEPCTFIKMDIEGAELKALIGAEHTIKKYHPKLAISIYHKTRDLLDLPLYIKSLNKDYKLYLRHYSSMWLESVLYAV